ncbi:hypothetical protein TNCV_4996641 [Trichonephila clavipes]|nr:hypothetical protein TNCV_4996641 [Trichonephila clavipes]
MQDNAKNPATRLVENFLVAETIQCMKWSAHSPDLNLIQNAWDAFNEITVFDYCPDAEIAFLKEKNSIP